MAEEEQRKINPMVYRVYRSTVQRVAVNVKNLNSHAAFLIVIEEDKQVLAWIGADCESDDVELVNNIGETILRKDFRELEEEEIPNIVEGSESTELLEVLLDVFWSNSGVYYNKATAKERKKTLVNSSVSVGLMEPVSWSADVYDFQETAFAHPDSSGTVPRVTFVPVEMETVAYVNIGDHWDVWFSRAVPDKEIEKVMEFVRSTVATQLSLVDATATRQNDVLAQHIHIIRQGEEGTLFRRPMKIFTDYEPPGKCAPRPAAAPRMKKSGKKGGAKKGDAALDVSALDVQLDEIKDKSGADLTLDVDGSNSVTPTVSEAPPVVDFWSALSQDDNNNSAGGGGHSAQQAGEVGTAGPVASETVTIKGSETSFGLDVDIITPSMLKVVEAENENRERRKSTIDEAAINPKSLIGYQVEIDDGVYAGVFVVTQVKKTFFMQRTMFHLTALDKDEFWIRLKRNKKGGQTFRPLRRVVDVTFNSDQPSGASSSSLSGGGGDDNSSRPGMSSSGDSEFYRLDGEGSTERAAGAAGGAGGGAGAGGEDGSQRDEYSIILNQYAE